MIRYIFKRLVMLIPVIIGVSFLIFVAMDLAPGNEIDVIYGESLTPEQQAQLEHEFGYDRSVFYRYGKYMLDFVQGDMGQSSYLKTSVLEAYFQRLPATAFLAISAILLAHVVSIPLGIFSARHQGSLTDNAGMVLGLLGISIPNFWMGLMLIIWLSLKVKLFPSGGMDGFKSVVLPAFTLGIDYIASLSRTTRSSMIDVIRQDYLRTARSKGVSEKNVINKHALKNALIPIVTVSGTQLAGILGGSAITETVFSWPGVGRLIVDAISFRDVKLATGALIMTTILSSIILLCVDILYAYIDPRLKAQYAGRRKKK